MNEIYVLMNGDAYDGYEVEGVYDTKAKAIEAYSEKSTYISGHFRLQTWELNGDCTSDTFLD